jgi:hypothetical protein
MNEKIKSLSKKLEGLFIEPITPQSIYHQMREITKAQLDYFRRLGPETMIKLIFGVYSLKKTGDFKLGEKILNNLFFIHLFETDGEYAVHTCGQCQGDGETDCPYCDEGKENCSTCEGTGEVDCPICDGNDPDCEECEGTGKVECPDCEGTGLVNCEYCNGSGTYECDNCDGRGEIESNREKIYYLNFLCSWNKDLKDECELKVDTLSPIENDVSGNDHIILYKIMDDGPISSEVESGRYYCISYSDEPDLSLFMDMQIFSSSNVYRLIDTD